MTSITVESTIKGIKVSVTFEISSSAVQQLQSTGGFLDGDELPQDLCAALAPAAAALLAQGELEIESSLVAIARRIASRDR